MKKTVVVYQSKYGYAKKYAQWIAQRLACPLIEGSKTNADSLLCYDTIIFGGGLYAGGINGIALITKNFEKLQGKNIIVFSVGLTDLKTAEQFQSVTNRNFTEPMQKDIKIFHFRGGMDFSKLNLAHRLMFTMLSNALKKKTSMTEGERQILSCYKANKDFTDESAIEPLISYCLNQTK